MENPFRNDLGALNPEDLEIGETDPGYYPQVEKAVEPVVEEFKPLDADNPNFGQVKEEDWDKKPTN